MVKGSQLSQLKSALSQAGLGRPPTSGKKRKRSEPQDEDKKAAKLDEIHRKLNPFDVKVTKLKHDVGGRRLKGISGKPAQSKQAGIEQRKRTLLKEYEDKGRAGGIVDRRFGENDPTISVEDRMLERFTRERRRASNSAIFNLEDEDDLTHYGQSLSKLDDFDGVGLRLDDEDEDSGKIDGDVVRKMHFGGFSDDEGENEEGEGEQPPRKKSKAEVMAEVIAKSKTYKHQRQKDRETEDNIRHQLDQEFDTLRSLLYVPDPSTTGSNSMPLGAAWRVEGDALPSSEAQDQDYDRQVRELAFDKRAQAKDRTKTEEEIALEEKEALEQAERRRRRRMTGEDSDSDQDVEIKLRRAPDGDDLDDDFSVGAMDWDGLGSGLAGAYKKGDERGALDSDTRGDEDEEDEAEDDDDEEEDVDECGDDDYARTDLSEGEGERSDPEDLVATSHLGKETAKHQTHEELPYTFSCPNSHEDFLQILGGIEDDDVTTVIQRIRALYHPSLGPDNKSKLQVLTSVLLDHILYISAPPTPRFAVLESLLPHLVTLTTSYPAQSAQYFVAKISIMHKNLLRGLSHGSLDPKAKIWPGLPELSLLRVIGSLWPTSDMRHAVISPTRLLMGAYLGLGRVRSLSDVASGLFLCTLFLQYEALSKRLVPEAINFLVNVVLHLAPHRFKDVAALPGSFPAPDFRSGLCRPLMLNAKQARDALVRKADLVIALGDRTLDEQTKLDLLGLALELLKLFAYMYKSLPGFIELYEPIDAVLRGVESEKLPLAYQPHFASILDNIGRLLKISRRSRRPLLLQAHKPIPIATYVPKFEVATSSYWRRRDPDHERNEALKLKRQYKQERKGAVRELRKDARFLAGVEQIKQKEKDREYGEKMKRVLGSIEVERAEQKAMEREKARDRKRAGKK